MSTDSLIDRIKALPQHSECEYVRLKDVLNLVGSTPMPVSVSLKAYESAKTSEQPVELGEQKPEQIKDGERIWAKGKWWQPE